MNENKQKTEIQVPHTALVINPSWTQVFSINRRGNEN